MKMEETKRDTEKEMSHKGTGHRKRLRGRFLQSGLDGFLDYEIVELLLTLGTPRRDCKQTAKEAIKKLGSLRGIFQASTEALQEVKGIGPNNVFGLKLFQAISERYAKEKLAGQVILDSSRAVAEYLQKSIGSEKKEHFVLLMLDTRNVLIKVSNISVGSLDANIVHPREVFKEAIRSSAAHIIVAHNHPSNNSEPSPEDIAITRRLAEAANIIGIDLLDHIIVTSNNFSSLKEQKLI